MDGYSHHEQKKLVLQVSKRGVESYKRGTELRKSGRQGGGLAKELLYARISVHMCAVMCYLGITLFAITVEGGPRK